MIGDSTPRLVDVKTFTDLRGSLGVVEEGDLPFTILRVYYLFDVPLGAVRGEHGHKTLQQLLICMHGVCDVVLNDGSRQHHFVLETPAKGLYVPPGMWRRLDFRAPETVCCVLASQPYDRDDYLFAFEDFRAWVEAKKGNGIPA